MQLFFSSMSIQNLPFRVSRGRLIAAMAASALDPHLLVGLDAKITPRVDFCCSKAAFQKSNCSEAQNGQKRATEARMFQGRILDAKKRVATQISGRVGGHVGAPEGSRNIQKQLYGLTTKVLYFLSFVLYHKTLY